MSKPEFTVIIPARFASSRLPGKPLADIAGKPMVVRVLEKAQRSGAKRVIIATDNEAVYQAVIREGGEACLTSDQHNSGTERLAEVIEKHHFADDEIIVNVQGDEPLIPPVVIEQVAVNLAESGCGMATLAVPICDADELFDPNAVKVLADNNGFALYFSRAPIPWDRDQFAQDKATIGNFYLRHVGIYAYRAGFIRQYVNWQPTALEQIEKLEQLRVLWYGEKIHVAVAKESPKAGVDTQADLEKVRAAFVEAANALA